jgi:hypothetical protein
MRTEPDQVAADALQFGDEHADPLHAVRHLQTEELFNGEHEGKAVGLRGQVIHPLDERDDLLPLFLLARLFDPGMEIANSRRHGHDGLAIKLQHQTQHTMRAGVLWPHVDGHRFSSDASHLSSIQR